jgi:glycosyltransferase involved in cell wall biosynthesis
MQSEASPSHPGTPTRDVARSLPQLPVVGIVVPCFNEQEVLPATAERLLALLAEFAQRGLASHRSRIWFVDDGSTDATWQIIQGLCARDARVRGIRLAARRGHQNALLAGLLTAEGDALVSIDADLQDDPAAIADMLERHRAGDEIVCGVRRARAEDSFGKRLSARAYYRTMRIMGADIIDQHADFRLMGRRSIEALRQFGEVNLFLRGLVPMLGFRMSTVAYDRVARRAGSSKYGLTQMLNLAWEGATAFGAAPLRLVAATGALIFVGSFALAGWAVFMKLFTDRTLPGWASTVVPIYVLGGLQLLALGVVGEYLGRIYLESKRRPRYSIQETAGQ